MQTNYYWKITLLAGLLTLLTASASFAQQMNYQGRLTDAAGNAVSDAQYSITFDIFDAATIGAKKWGPQTIQADTVQGRFNVILGPTDTTARNIVNAFDGGTRFLQITFQGSPILPRQQILSSPTAFFAETAGRLASVFVLNGNVGIGKTNPATALDVAGGAAISGNVGIGTTSPGALLDIRHNSGLNEQLRLSGSAYNGGVGGSVQGISFLLGFNNEATAGGRADLLIGYSGRLAATDSVVRIIPGGVNAISYIDAVTRDNGTFKDLGIQGASMLIKANGNVGIGTNNPASKLDVAGNANITGTLQVQNPGANTGNIHVGSFTSTAGNPKLINFGDGDFVHVGESAADDTLELKGTRISMVGNVGIGTATPTRAKLEITGGVNGVVNIGGFLNRNGASDLSNSDQTRDYSLYCSSVIVGSEIFANSDARIKNIKGHSDGAADLATLNRIDVTDYLYKDFITQGSNPQKKVIAQQVEKIFPQAISQHTDVVPDIYEKAQVEDGWVKLTTNLKKGERVRLISEKKEGIHEVLEVTEGKFRTDFADDGDAVFVFGREVKDFRTVDYDAIAMLNVSATQELARRLEKLEARESHLAELEQKAARVATLEQDVADLKKMVAQLASAGKGTEQAAQAITPPRPAVASLQTAPAITRLDR